MTETSSAKPKITAIIITYNPDRGELGRLLDAIEPQVDDIVAVDNGSAGGLEAWFASRGSARTTFLPMNENIGIAAAQNAGIKWAREHGSAYILLLDHDSLPAPDMVSKLWQAMQDLIASGKKVATVGPKFVDKRQGNPPPFARTEGYRLVRCGNKDDKEVLLVDYVIASGSLIPLSIIDEVGDMNADMFIDYVDIEWGLRASRFGYGSYGVCCAVMNHSLGDEPIMFFGRAIPLHSALRHYYLFRNRIWLYRQPEIPTNWKIVDGYRLVRNFAFYALFARPHLRHVQMMVQGMRDGFAGKLGKFQG